jgi:segregation and condensation protein A
MAFDVATPVYEGPFDLLLHLILREQVDIYEVRLSRIVDAYLGRSSGCSRLDLEIATEFLLIASTLVELKAKRLLPGPRRRRPGRRAVAVGGARPAAGPPARVQDVQGRRRGLRSFRNDDADRRSRASRPDERFADLAPDLLDGVTPADPQRLPAVRPRPSRQPPHRPVPRQPDPGQRGRRGGELIDELPRAGRISFRRLTADWSSGSR